MADTPNQRSAKQRAAERRRCPNCDRKSALSSYYDDDLGERVRVCRWCGWATSPTYRAITK